LQHPRHDVYIVKKESKNVPLLDGLLPVTPSDSDSVDKVALLGLVSESASLVGSRGSGSSVDDSELSVLPAPDRDGRSCRMRQGGETGRRRGGFGFGRRRIPAKGWERDVQEVEKGFDRRVRMSCRVQRVGFEYVCKRKSWKA
jgi:hypothetical protein